MNNIQPKMSTARPHNRGRLPDRHREANTVTVRHGRPRPDRAAADPARTIRDLGQATTEYALVLLAAALVGVLVIGWATAGGGAAAINRLFNAVIDAVIGNI